MNQQQTSSSRVSRRHVLTALGATMAGLSGCLGGLLGSGQQQVITKTTFKPFKLAVTLRKEASVSQINLIAPNGTTVTHKSVSAGQTTVEVPLVDINTDHTDYIPLAPGTYTIVAANNGNTVAQKKLKLSASWKVAKVQAKNGSNLIITLRNTGDLPVKVKYIGVTSGVSNPDDPPQQGDLSPPPRANALDRTQMEHFIGHGKRATFGLYDNPLSFYFLTDPRSSAKKGVPQWQLKAAKCRGLTHDATLVLTVAPTGKQIYSLPITYSGGTPITQQCPNVTVGDASQK